MSESDIHRLEQQNAELFRLLRQQAEKQADMSVALARIEERLMAHQCSRPGLCTDLQAEVNGLKAAVSEARGGWKLFLALPAVAAALGALGVWWAKK
jgi:prophage DNA circulation protein